MPHIRMRIDIVGMFEGNPTGVRRGDVVELDNRSAERYVLSGYADYVAAAPVPPPPPVEKAVAPEHHVETAKLEIPPEVAALAKPKPLDEPEDEEPVYGETHPPEHPDEQLTKRRAPARRAGK
jgi:hypothetical protein